MIKLEKGVTIEGNSIVGYDNLTHLHNAETYQWQKYKEDVTRLKAGVLVRPFTIIYHGCQIGESSMIGSHVTLREYTHIGKRSHIGNGTSTDGYCRIGDETVIHSLCHITATVEIGNKCFIAPGTIFSNGYINWMRPHFNGYGDGLAHGAIVKDGVRIGIGVVILPGVTIGEEAFIGAGSIVTKDVPPFTYVAGCPARIIREVPEIERIRL